MHFGILDDMYVIIGHFVTWFFLLLWSLLHFGHWPERQQAVNYYLAMSCGETLSHTLYSPDLVSCDFYLPENKEKICSAHHDVWC